MPPPSPRGTRSSGAVLETEKEQDIAIGAFADAEAEEFDFASDSLDDNYSLPVPPHIPISVNFCFYVCEIVSGWAEISFLQVH